MKNLLICRLHMCMRPDDCRHLIRKQMEEQFLFPGRFRMQINENYIRTPLKLRHQPPHRHHRILCRNVHIDLPQKIDNRNPHTLHTAHQPALTARSRLQVHRPHQIRTFIQMIQNLMLRKRMIAKRNHIHAIILESTVDTGRNALAMGGIFTIDNGEIRPAALLQCL